MLTSPIWARAASGAIASVLIVTFAACSAQEPGSADAPQSSSPAGSATTPVAPETTSAPTSRTTSEPAEEDVTPGGASALPTGNDFCVDLEALVQTSQQFFEVTFAEISGGPAPSPEDIRQAAAPLPERVTQAKLSAPGDLLDELDTMGAYLLSVTGAFEAADFEVDDVEQIPQPTPEVDAAEDLLNEHARTECGFDPDQAGQ